MNLEKFTNRSREALANAQAKLAAAEAELNALGIPNQKAFAPYDIEASEHYKVREDIITWTDSIYGEMKGIGLPNKFTRNPAQVVASAPTFGEHSREILEELGFSEDDINDMYAKGETSTMDPKETAVYWRLKDYGFFWRPDQAEKLEQ